MLKRITAVFMCVLLLLSVAASAFAKTYVIVNSYRVAKNSDGTFEIGGYQGSITDITVPSNFYGTQVTTVESRAFAENTSLNSVVLPDTMRLIGNGAFSDSEITSIVIGKNTQSIGSNAFYNCNKLKTVDLGTALTAIPGYAFNRCSSLTNVELPDTVERIGEYAFFRCTSLEYILIPSSVTEIAANAFEESNRVTIRGEIDSYAYVYAQAHSIPFESVSGGQTSTEPNDDVLIGDADGNGIINNDDVRMLQMFCANRVDRSYIVPANSDVNGDGVLNIKDCTNIQRYIAYGRF